MKQRKKSFALIALLAAQASGAEPGGSVVVIYNTRVPESKHVAEHYAERRNVPASQVFGLKLPTTETISRNDFRDDLQKPLFDRLVKEKLFIANPARRPDPPAPAYRPLLEASVRYLVLCYGVPLKITADPMLNEPGIERLQPELRRNEAAVDSELALLPISREKLTLAGPQPNPFYGNTNREMLHPTNGVMLVSRLDGPSVEIANALVDKAIQAETNGFWGRAYFDARGITETNYRLGDEWMRNASRIARRLGFDTALDEAPATFPPSFPMSHIALYAGWYDGNVSGPFTLPNVEFMPGAFAYHLHSYSASTIRSAGANWVGPLLAKGATITFGCVEEPYLAGTPNIPVFVERLVFNRFTFGEAACVAQGSLSWQTTVVGDPLYRPFAEAPDVLHRRLEVEKNPAIAWSHLRVVNLNLASGMTSPDGLIKYLQDIPATKGSALLTEKLGDLHREAKRLPAAAEAYTAAVKLNPSPQQRIRLLLATGELQTLLAREPRAYDAYRQLLADAPDYPNIIQIYHRLIPLARFLKKTNDVEQFEKEVQRLTEKK